MSGDEHPTRSRFARRKRAEMAQVVADSHALSAWYAAETAEAACYEAERRFWQTAAWCVAIVSGVIVGGSAFLLLTGGAR